MKQSQNLTELSNEELQRSFKQARMVLKIFFSIFILLLVTCLYITVTKGFGVFTILPLTFIPLIIANIFSYGKVKEEMKNRNLLS
ncbi:hypothetical protein [Epilithonimonas arachidiradicis]|uniref:Redox-active disulfide protein 2 n=1 Tax=Epilithonimonas arachidiradicis TaxID=1617282 RepID=A0A420CMP1_9FLAO|nr:hypothetical protein [Epilithonimonas arachidiradicis]RKE79670.1 hypothetical protein BXY58_3034 [Epilithonimonas arachidiradicis]